MYSEDPLSSVGGEAAYQGLKRNSSLLEQDYRHDSESDKESYKFK